MYKQKHNLGSIEGLYYTIEWLLCIVFGYKSYFLQEMLDQILMSSFPLRYSGLRLSFTMDIYIYISVNLGSLQIMKNMDIIQIFFAHENWDQFNFTFLI